MSNIYADHGYDNRYGYLKGLAEEYDIPLETVRELANLLGPKEDFDGLISALEDFH